MHRAARAWAVFVLASHVYLSPAPRPHNSGLKLKINPDDEDIPNRKHIQRTPMIAAGKTNHIWTMGEPLTFSHFKTSVN